MPEGTYKSLKSRGNIDVYGLGGNGRQVLVDYKSLPSQYREQVVAKLGDPEELVKYEPIKSMVVRDLNAHLWYTKYKLPNGQTLKPDKVETLTMAASWLNLMRKLLHDRSYIKEHLNMTMADWWDVIGELIATNNIDLPTSRKRLKERVVQYATEGYECLISDSYGNTNRLKVIDEVAAAVLMKLISHHNQLDAQLVCDMYNTWAVKEGYEPISRATVIKWKQKNAMESKAGRDGYAAMAKKYGKSIMGMRPTAPLLLCEHDDNVVDLFFGGDKAADAYNRVKGYFVIDAYNDYILGYAIGWEVNAALVAMAWLNAMHHIKELTGKYYQPGQLRCDHYAAKALEPLYLKLAAHYTPAKVKNAQGKYIERAFGKEWHNNLRVLFPNNYTGHNISSPTSGTNRELLAQNNKLYLPKEKAPEAIAAHVQRLRMAQKDGVSRQQAWLTAFNNSEASKERELRDEWVLLHLGIQTTRPITIGRDVVELNIGGVKYHYQVPREAYMQMVGSKMAVNYDPNNMNRILLHNDKYRYVAQTVQKVPRALYDRKPGDGMLLNKQLEIKDGYMQQVIKTMGRRTEVLESAGIDPQNVIMGAYQRKELAQATEAAYYEAAEVVEEVVEEVANVVRVLEEEEEEDDDWRKQVLNS